MRAALITLALAAVCESHGVDAQLVQGSTGSTLGGAALGLYSAGYSTLVGSLLPCNRTSLGSRCATAAASVGAAVGLSMGGLIGAQNQSIIQDRARSAGYGVLVGAVVGTAVRYGVRQYGWADAAAVALYGGAVGAAPMGTGLGALAGAGVGGLVWLIFPESGLPDFLVFVLAGSALGTMVDWTWGASDAKLESSPTIVGPTISIPIG